MAAAAAAAAKAAAERAAAEVEAAMEALFKAYDIDESGDLSRREFLGIEMRLDFDEGTEFRSMAGLAKMTLTDTDSSGTLEYDEFRTRFLSAYQEMNISSSEIVRRINEQTEKALQERARMGPRYHAGIRAALRRLFALFDVDGNGVLTPEEWVSAQKTVAVEISDDLDEGWLDEAAFHTADTNKDGVLDIAEFLEASFSMFEGVKKRTDDLLAILHRMVQLLEKETLDGRKETPPIVVYVQSREKPPFQSPQEAWKDETTVDDPEPDDGATMWEEGGELALPLNLATAEDVAALLRLFLKKPPDTWLSLYYLGSPKDGGVRPVVLVRGDRPGEGNVQAMLQYLCKPNADLKLFVKNVRQRPKKLSKQPRAFLEERDGLLAKKTGQCWGLDWETQLVGDGQKLPPRPLPVTVGDTLVVEVPVECGAPLDRYVCSIYMDETNVLSKPVDESIVPKAKKKSKKAASAPPPDPLLQLNFVALKEGKCVLFVDVSWEDQEEALALERKLCKPVHENSIARIGPVEVEVHPQAGKPEAGTFVWWNGEKWSNKKGPAKKKGKRK